MLEDKPGWMRAIGRRIREERTKKAWTQSELAYEAGLSVTTIANLESARQSLPSLGTIAPIAKSLETSLDWLILGERGERIEDAVDVEVKFEIGGGRDV